jgi:DNA-directed RNA polymerase specialized sigma24 family protein
MQRMKGLKSSQKNGNFLAGSAEGKAVRKININLQDPEWAKLLQEDEAEAAGRKARLKALYALIGDHEIWLRRYVLGLGVNDPDSATEVARNAVLRYLQLLSAEYRCENLDRCRSYIDRNWTKKWLQKTARGILRDEARKSKKICETDGEVYREELDTSERVDVQRAHELFVQILGQLPPVQRAAWVQLKGTSLTPAERESLLTGVAIPQRDLSPDATKAEQKLKKLIRALDLKDRSRLAPIVSQAHSRPQLKFGRGSREDEDE